MTGLLVSVRDVAEAEIVFAGGADLIDVKEPLRGALGAADPQIWDDVLRAVGGRVPTSAAMGELCDCDWPPIPANFTFAKLGLAGCGGMNNWAELWQQTLAQFPADVQPVAVIYADYEIANSPPPDEILARAKSAGCSAVLVDTFDKSHGGLLDHFSLVDIKTLVRTCRRQNLVSVLAGSLTESTIEKLLPLKPNYVGVRGAACEGARTGRLDLGRVKSLAQLVRRSAKKMSAASA
jgi:uncharacterized protein (UPF0264 family)